MKNLLTKITCIIVELRNDNNNDEMPKGHIFPITNIMDGNITFIKYEMTLNE